MGIKCPECNSEDLRKFGFQLSREGKKQRYQCRVCGRLFIQEYTEHGKQILKGQKIQLRRD